MPSIATTFAATALASLTLAAPTTRQASPVQFNIAATSVYSTGKQYSNSLLSGCHTAAGQEAFCAVGATNGGNFSLSSATEPNGPGNIDFYLPVNGGSDIEVQPLTFTQNSTYPTIEYGFFGSTGDSKQYVIDDADIISVSGGGPGASTFYLCPEYVDYDHEGYPTVSLVGEYSDLPANSGCDAVTLKRIALKPESYP